MRRQLIGFAVAYSRVASLPSTGSAFVHQTNHLSPTSLSSFNPTRPLSKLSSNNGSVCDVSDIQVPDLVATSGSAFTLREAILKDVNGESIRLGDRMGPDTSIVVFLRHLA